jgi:hypothetical protein
VILELGRHRDQFQTRVCITAQHRHLLEPILRWFRIPVHDDLDVMRPNQELCGLSALILERFHEVLASHRPDMVLVQGDTTTVMAGEPGGFLSPRARGPRGSGFAHAGPVLAFPGGDQPPSGFAIGQPALCPHHLVAR